MVDGVIIRMNNQTSLSTVALLSTYFETIASSAKKRKHLLYKWNMSKNQAGRDTAAVSDSQPRALSFLR